MSSVSWLFLVIGTLAPMFGSIPLAGLLKKMRWGIENSDTSQQEVWFLKALMGVAIADLVSVVLGLIPSFSFRVPMIHHTIGVTVILVALIIGILNLYRFRLPVAKEPKGNKQFRDLRRMLLILISAFPVISLLLFLVL